MSLVQPGVCRHCGCKDHEPCILQTGDTCAWMSRDRTVCSNPACVRAEVARLADYRRRVFAEDSKRERERRERYRRPRRKKRAA